MRPLLRWTLCLAAALCASPAAGEQLLMATGSDQAVVLVRTDAEAKTYDVVARQIDGPWTWIDRDAGGVPIAAATVNRQLHLLFSDPLGHVVHDLRFDQPQDPQAGLAQPGRNPADPRWADKAAPVALCGAPNWNQGEQASPLTLLAVVPRPASMAGTQPTTEPETPPDDGRVRLGAFIQLGGVWSYLADVPGRYELPANGRLLAATVGQTLYVLVGDQADRDVLLAYIRDQWRTLPTDSWPRGARAMALLAIDDKMLAVLAGPAETSAAAPADGAARTALHLAGWNAEADRFDLQPVVMDSQPFTLPAEAELLAARLAHRIAMFWQDGEAMQAATCGTNGQMLTPGKLDAFVVDAEDGRGVEVLQAFMMGLLVALFVPLLLVRPAGPPKPFSLPPTMRPGDPLKRLIAAALDFVPCAAVAGLAFQVQPHSMEQLQAMAERGVVPTNLAYAMVTTLLLYTAYAMVMEWKFRATPGMMLFRLKVVGDEGKTPDPRSLFLRHTFRILELMFTWHAVPWLLLTVLFTRYRQRLGDMFARTTVINAAYVAPPEPPEEEESPQDLGPLPPKQDEQDRPED